MTGAGVTGELVGTLVGGGAVGVGGGATGAASGGSDASPPDNIGMGGSVIILPTGFAVGDPVTAIGESVIITGRSEGIPRVIVVGATVGEEVTAKSVGAGVGPAVSFVPPPAIVKFAD